MSALHFRMRLYLEPVSLQMKLVPVRSDWVRACPKSNEWSPQKKRTGHTEIRGKEGRVRMGTGMREIRPQAKEF